jgi:GntR family transcriptional repressor for pyruvate dehydrogenase complex
MTLPDCNSLSPLKVSSVKDACVRLLENKILSGEWKIAMRLPSERTLAQSLEISRIILHEALVDLASKGLVTIQPRRGIFVNDYRKNGSCGLLSSIMAYQNETLDPEFVRSLVEMRQLLETETARLAARSRTSAHIAELLRILAEEEKVDRDDFGQITELDFAFHQQIAIASGNLMYPLIINSFRNVYTHLTGIFFRIFHGKPETAQVQAYHRELIQAIQAGDQDRAQETMQALLTHGSALLFQELERSK